MRKDMYLRWGTDDELPGAHTEVCVYPVGDGHHRVRIQDIPGSMEVELLIQTKDLAEFAKRLAKELVIID